MTRKRDEGFVEFGEGAVYGAGEEAGAAGREPLAFGWTHGTAEGNRLRRVRLGDRK